MRGHIEQRSEGSWTIVVNLGRGPDGKRKQKWVTVKGTKKKAEQKLTDLLKDIDSGSFVSPKKITVGEFLSQWLRDYASTNVRPNTLESYRKVVDGHLIPALGGMPLHQLQPQHLQAYYANALAKGRKGWKSGSALSPTFVRGHHRIMYQALSHAVKWRLVGRNVAQAVDPPRPEHREMAAMDGAEVRRFLEAVRDTEYYPLFHLDIHTGLRRSELLGLRWRDVDLDLLTISVVQVLHQLRDGSFLFQEPKTAKGRRQVALTPSSSLVLREHREKQEAVDGSLGRSRSSDDLVFCHYDGSPLLPDVVSHAFARIARKAGLKGVRLHDLRHTHASLMLQQGVHPKIVSERLGHANIQMTLDTYSHVLPGLQEAAALRFEEGLVPRIPNRAERVPISSG